MVPAVAPDEFRLNASAALNVIELAPGLTAETVKSAVLPEVSEISAFVPLMLPSPIVLLFCNTTRSPALRPVLPLLMTMQEGSKVTVVVDPEVTMVPFGAGLGFAAAQPATPPFCGARKIGNSFSQCWLASTNVVSA